MSTPHYESLILCVARPSDGPYGLANYTFLTFKSRIREINADAGPKFRPSGGFSNERGDQRLRKAWCHSRGRDPALFWIESTLKTDDIEAVEQMVGTWVQENKFLRSKRPAEFISTSADSGPLQMLRDSSPRGKAKAAS